MNANESNFSDVTKLSTDVTSGPKIWSVEHLVMTSVVLGGITLCTVVGNAFVIVAIILERNLRSVANYLILSLAVADFLVASVVMPISTVNEVTQRWFLGSEVCDMWVTMDVLCCTASILSLLAIAIDRYRAVTNIAYMQKRTARLAITMITVVWIVSMLISFPSVLIFKDDADSAQLTGVCIVSQDHIYTIYSTVGSFYLPTIALIVIYAKIFNTARERILRKRFSHDYQPCKEEQTSELQKQNNAPEMPRSQKESSASISESELSVTPVSGSSGSENSDRTKEQRYISTPLLDSEVKPTNTLLHAKKEKEKRKRKKEKKLAFILTLITGSFILCWLPFSILATAVPFMTSSQNVPELLSSTALWLGYCNSLLNPIIYTIFSEDFRSAFKNLILGKCLQRK